VAGAALASDLRQIVGSQLTIMLRLRVCCLSTAIQHEPSRTAASHSIDTSTEQGDDLPHTPKGAHRLFRGPDDAKRILKTTVHRPSNV